MTAATGYIQIRGPRPGNRITVAELLVPRSPEQTNRIVIANRHYVDVNHCPGWTRGQYTERYTDPGP